ncbi:MAG: phosphoribosylglycinamide formyltransferase, partial [Rhodothermia bacterium]
MDQLRLAIFASGSGSNMQAIVDAAEAGDLDITVGAVVSNKPDAGVLDRARAHDIPTIVMDPRAYPDTSQYVSELLTKLEECRINFVALAGYLKIIPPEIVARFRGRILNIHPALLPAFGGKGYYGRRVHAAVLEHGVQWTGVTVHLVDEEYDTGPIVLQKPVRVDPDDTPESLAARVLKTEHEIYPAALKMFTEGRARIDGRRV